MKTHGTGQVNENEEKRRAGVPFTNSVETMQQNVLQKKYK